MANGKNEPWDVVPDMREGTFGHLSKLAAEAVTTLLGPSPQDADYAREVEDYERRLAYWKQREAQLAERPEEKQAFDELPPEPPPKKKLLSGEDLDAWLRRKIQDRILGKLDSIILDLLGLEHGWGGSNGLRFKSGGSQTALGQRLLERAKEMAVKLADQWVEENKEVVFFRDRETSVRMRKLLMDRQKKLEEQLLRVQEERNAIDSVSMTCRKEKEAEANRLDHEWYATEESLRQVRAKLASLNASGREDGLLIDGVFTHFRYELEKETKAAISARIKALAEARAKLVRQDVLEAAVDKAMYDTYPILRRAEGARRLGVTPAKEEDAA